MNGCLALRDKYFIRMGYLDNPPVSQFTFAHGREGCAGPRIHGLLPVYYILIISHLSI
jgi:hypothetical protein